MKKPTAKMPTAKKPTAKKFTTLPIVMRMTRYTFTNDNGKNKESISQIAYNSKNKPHGYVKEIVNGKVVREKKLK